MKQVLTNIDIFYKLLNFWAPFPNRYLYSINVNNKITVKIISINTSGFKNLLSKRAYTIAKEPTIPIPASIVKPLEALCFTAAVSFTQLNFGNCKLIVIPRKALKAFKACGKRIIIALSRADDGRKIQAEIDATRVGITVI